MSEYSKMSKKEVNQEISNIISWDKYRERFPLKQTNLEKEDPLGKSLDWFIGEWNRQAKEITEKNKELLLDWGSK